jgi:hypothetical protein
MVLINAPANVDRLEPAGAPHTTSAGRYALPVNLMDGKCRIATLELVFDEAKALELQRGLDGHLAGLGAEGAPRRLRADLR